MIKKPQTIINKKMVQKFLLTKVILPLMASIALKFPKMIKGIIKNEKICASIEIIPLRITAILMRIESGLWTFKA